MTPQNSKISQINNHKTKTYLRKRRHVIITMGRKQGQKDIEVNRKTENRTDMIISSVIHDDTIMSKENRKQFGYEICYIYIYTYTLG